MTDATLKEILKKHEDWLYGKPGGVRANLFRANLSEADLSEADLSGTYLSRANLSGADLSGTYLSRANLFRANLSEANLSGAKKMCIPLSCPEEGSFIGFKKANLSQGCCIVKLRIPDDALRSSATSRKCRCSKAEVVSITNLDGSDSDSAVAFSIYDNNFLYEVGKMVTVPNFDNDRWNECAPGINFFITREEAVNY